MIRTIFAVLLVTIPLLSAAQSDAPIRRPEIRVGDNWTYRGTNILAPGTHEYEVRASFIDDKVILVVATRKSDEKEFDASYTHEWNSNSDYTGRIYRPHTNLLRFPLRIGEKHDSTHEMARPRLLTELNINTFAVKVIGWDTVEVPAGKFRALKVVWEGEGRLNDGSRPYAVQGALWYAPDVRRWVKYQAASPTGERSEELLAYKLNED